MVDVLKATARGQLARSVEYIAIHLERGWRNKEEAHRDARGALEEALDEQRALGWPIDAQTKEEA